MKSATQRRLRDLHNWLGVFFAPGIIFFAFSGILQTLGLHESGPGRQPATPFIGVLASVHKEGEAALPKRRPPVPAVPAKLAGPSKEQENGSGFPLFKVYALLLSVALIASAVMGIAVALANRMARQRTWSLLAAGCIVPLVLLAI